MSKLTSSSLIVLFSSFACSSKLFAVTADNPSDNVPWSDLKKQVGDGQFIDSSPSLYYKECYDPAFSNYSYSERTNYDLIDQPSGLCMSHLFTAFKQAIPDPLFLNGDITRQEWEDKRQAHYNEIYSVPPAQGSELYNQLHEWLDPSNPAYNLPEKVIFPKFAKDVVAAVEFAKKHNLKISVKNSGHSYTGASTSSKSLLVNMNQFEKYASPDGAGLVVCDANSADAGSDGFGDQPCKVALSRGKPAALRIGGGENWDKVYRAVQTINKKETEYKYHVVGGAAGTVSPMGWSWQGGLSGTSAGRIYGFGVDQILQIEAVLPNGQHVIFGPIEWEEDNAYTVPKTTKVSGLCNDKPQETDEKNWDWKSCPKDVEDMFHDLWFAFRGGGGGTWGVVLSIHVQLHDYLPFVYIKPDGECFGAATKLMNEQELGYTSYKLTEMSLNWFLDPGAIGITKEESNSCGLPGSVMYGVFYCYAEDVTKLAETIVAKYRASISELSADSFAIAKDCLVAQQYNDLGESEISQSSLSLTGSNAGKVPDSPYPMYPSTTDGVVNHLIPKSWILQNKELFTTFWMSYSRQMYFAFGGNTEFAHDQTASLSSAHRKAGVMVQYFHHSPPPWIGDVTDFSTKNIPPYIGGNHLGPNTYGPLIDDHTKPCPFNFTRMEAETKCVSAQEAVHGTESLKRLESIKKKVDPNHMFECFRCIGTPDPLPSTSPLSSPSTLPTTSPLPSTSHANKIPLIHVIFGTIVTLLVI